LAPPRTSLAVLAVLASLATPRLARANMDPGTIRAPQLEAASPPPYMPIFPSLDLGIGLLGMIVL
jgi:hypothetical protein